MRFALTLLGTNAAFPTLDRFSTSQVLTVHNRHFLIDCGEGAQIRMQQFGVRTARIRQVFISHLHGDHVNGLTGWLTSQNLSGRQAFLEVYGPEGLEEMVRAVLRYTHTELHFPVTFFTTDPTRPQTLLDDELLSVTAFPLLHRIPCCGFVFREKPRPHNVRPDQIERYGLTVAQILEIKAGKGIELPDGRKIPHEELAVAPAPPRAYAFCSDTAYTESILPFIRGVDLLYHESTFCEDQAGRAAETGHSTARQAALIARKAGAGRLILGHFSSRYPDTGCFEEEARAIFPNVSAGFDGAVYEAPRLAY